MRKLFSLLAVTATVTLIGAVYSPAADAAPATWPCTRSNCVKGDILGYVEANPSVNVRTAPCATSACGIAGHINYSTQVAIRCYERGDTVTGWGGTTNEWDLILDQGEGFLGWVSDAWINTGGDTASMVSRCP